MLFKKLTIVVLITLCSANTWGASMNELRDKMVETQIIARGIKDKRVLDAMRKVPRDEFVPFTFIAESYGDYPLPIGHDQTISQPYIVALMTELLELKGNEKVLEIGTGSGYQAAVLAEIAGTVYSIDRIKDLVLMAEKKLKDLGYKNINVKYGDGFNGWPEYAHYDGIIVTCAPKEIPQVLLDQLAEGGRLVIPVGDFFQNLKVVTKKDGKIKERDVIPVRFVPMKHNVEL